ncbi:NB-ARC domain-containing protein [Actinoallomurus sp. NBC_01490]|uniref:AfsR/SARP family transcriptional regulator n=1 Tax=Actinoallomurus sp. NBC_01490 TaxID=2903557 RepID=UPI002E32A303|nr:BTAD domain-containing putative transcriptional regulator [Actinoallomurus sp. NBC_01490]
MEMLVDSSDDDVLAFSVLGPLTVRRGGEPVDLGTPKACGVMAILLTRPDRPVSIDTIVDALWEDEPPKTAVKNVQVYIHHLRRALGSADRIVRQSPGYRLVVRPGELDAQRFADLARAGRTAEDPADLLREALGLWQGDEAYDGIHDIPLIRTETRRLGEARIAVIQDLIDADLRHGRLAHLTAELTALTNRYPLREGLWARLMTALYHCRRQAEALRVYERARRIIADETGLDPGQELRDLQQMILTAQPATDVLFEVPRMLPGDVADFTGRSAELASAEESLRRPGSDAAPVRLVAVSGRGGIGKTAFAVHLAHRVEEAYDGGQLYAGLSGTGPGEVLGIFLRLLGVAAGDIPDGVEDRATLYRHRLARRRVLVVLDNVGSEAQIMPLLPGSGACAVLTTSRGRLGGLPGAHAIDLDALPPSDGHRLLNKITGTRDLGEAADALLRLCAGLPLALRIVGAQLATRPHRTPAELVERLNDERDRLDVLRHGDLAVRATFEISYRALSAAARRLFRLLGLLEAPDFAAWTAAAVLDTSAERAQELLDEVIDARLLDAAAGRYRFHDLVRIYAGERAQEEEPEAERTAALRRAFGGWLAFTDAAHRAAGDGVYAADETPRWHPEIAAEAFTRSSIVEVRTECRALVAAVAQSAALGMTGHCWQLALGGVPIFAQGNFVDEWTAAQECAFEACVAAGDRRGQAAMFYMRGLLHDWRRSHPECRDSLSRALEIFDDLGDRHGSALAVHRLASNERLAGRVTEAIALSRRAHHLLHALGDHGAAADALVQVGVVHLESGDATSAVEVLDEAMRQAVEHDATLVLAQGAYWISAAQIDLGRLDDAARSHAILEDFVRRVGSPTAEVYAHYSRGLLDAARGERDPARERLESALNIAREIEDPLMQVRVLCTLGDLHPSRETAALYLYEAAEIAEELRMPLWQALAAEALGRLHTERGDHDAARAAWRYAHDLFVRIGSPRAGDVARLLEARTAHTR